MGDELKKLDSVDNVTVSSTVLSKLFGDLYVCFINYNFIVFWSSRDSLG